MEVYFGFGTFQSEIKFPETKFMAFTDDFEKFKKMFLENMEDCLNNATFIPVIKNVDENKDTNNKDKELEYDTSTYIDENGIAVRFRKKQ